jgi:lysylphosphatidylglycerol synthetase-like protein (DUF2156 family)
MSLAIAVTPRIVLRLSPRARQISVMLAVLCAVLTIVEPAWLGLTPDLSTVVLRLWSAVALLMAARALRRGSRDAAVLLSLAALGGVMLEVHGDRFLGAVSFAAACALLSLAAIDCNRRAGTSLRAVFYPALFVAAGTPILAVTITEGPGTHVAALLGMSLVASSAALLVLLRTPTPAASPIGQADARRLLRLQGPTGELAGSANSIWAYAAEADKRLFVASDGTSVVAYRVRAGVALAAGDPVCVPGNRRQVAREFVAFCRRNALVPALYQVLATSVDHYLAIGMRAVKIGEEAVIDVPRFSLSGKKIANVRHCVTHIEREGLVAEVHGDGVVDDATYGELEAVSAAWIGSRSGRGEMGFSMGAFGPRELQSACVVIGRDATGRARAFVTFRRVARSSELVLDLMRREPAAPSGTIDFLIAKALEYFRDTGIERASLSLAPLANAEVDGRSPWLERLLGLAFERGDAIYRYRSLFNFKRKFAPTWESRYLVTQPGLPNMLRALLAVALVHMPKRAWHVPSKAVVAGAVKAYVGQCLNWRTGLEPHELQKNLRLMWMITFALSLPELRVSLLQLSGHNVSRAFALAAVLLAATNIAGAILLARRSPLGRALIQAGAMGFFVKTAWAFAQRYDGGIISVTMALVLAPIEVWVFWFLAQPEIAAWHSEELGSDRAVGRRVEQAA